MSVHTSPQWVDGADLRVNDVVYDRADRGPWTVTEIKVTYCGVVCHKLVNRATGAVLHYPVTGLFQRVTP